MFVNLTDEKLSLSELENLDNFLAEGDQSEVLTLSQIHGFLCGIVD